MTEKQPANMRMSQQDLLTSRSFADRAQRNVCCTDDIREARQPIVTATSSHHVQAHSSGRGWRAGHRCDQHRTKWRVRLPKSGQQGDS
jgi:hypothetical protein